jgi:hypothetical protein
MAKQLNIAFTADKNGTPIAYKWSVGAMRWIKMSMDDAKLMVATGAARQVKYSK